MAKLLQRKQYLISDAGIDHQDLTCMICLDIILVPVQCQGCKTVYCASCASKWKADANMCPKKCSEVWNFTPCAAFPITFRCPHSSKCGAIGPMEFVSHVQSCHESPEETRQAWQRRLNYECSNGHKLEFWKAKTSVIKNTSCFECDDHTCRSICKECDEKYCVNCRVPKCSKEKCPLGHRMIYLQDYGTGFTCDICGVVPEVFGSGVGIWEDPKCNFGVCEVCHENLQQELA